MISSREIDKCFNLDILESERESANRDCKYFNNCSICPLRYKGEVLDCILKHLARRIKAIESRRSHEP